MFDEVGEVQRPDLVRRDFDSRASSRADFLRSLIVDCGWVGLYQVGEQLIVFLRPAKVCPGALSGALYWIADAAYDGSGPGRLVTLDGTTPPLSHTYQQRHELLSAVCDAVNAAQPADEHRFARRAAQRSELNSNSPIIGLLSIWHELGGRLDIERMWRLLHRDFQRRFIVLSTDAGAMRVRNFGRGYSVLGSYWDSTARGVRVRDQPDMAYGRWVEHVYRDVDEMAQPCVEAVDCDVDWPQEGRRRHRYWRAMAPFRLADGQRVVLGASIDDAGISLRPELAKPVSTALPNRAQAGQCRRA
jgi:hypothetical protein